jgi:polyphosphate kinase
MNQLSALNYRDIGIAIYKLDPGIALKLLKDIEEVKPLETNIKKIPVYFDRFCAFKQIDGINCKLHTKTEYVYLRHVFIAVVIKLYNPELLSSIHYFRMKRQLRVALSKSMNTHVTWISQSVTTVVTRLKIYEDFRADVDETIAAIK